MPARVHRPGDPAHQPGLGHPADGRAGPRRHGRLPVRRAAGPARTSPTACGCSRNSAPSPRADAPGQGRTRLTETGRKLARLPLDPRLGRMVLEAGRNGCVREVLIIAAALSIHDPRERPTDARQAADADARPVRRAGLGLPGLPEPVGLPARAAAPSCPPPRSGGCAGASTCTTCGCASGRTCTASSGRPPRTSASRRAGTDGTSRSASRAQHGASSARPAGPGGRGAGDAARRRSRRGSRIPADWPTGCTCPCWPGCSRTSACRTPSQARGSARPLTEFAGARGARFAIFPDSALARKPPHWVVAAELVETSRLWARVAARIEPEWAEALAAHLVRRSYSEPHWDARRGAAVATERVTPVRAADRGRPDGQLRPDRPGGRPGAVHPARAGRGRLADPPQVLRPQPAALADAEELERKARRRGLVADDAALFAFYDRRIPAEVISARHFDTWWKQARRADPACSTSHPPT